MTGYTWRNHPLVAQGPRLQVWRGATDNDGIKGWTGQATKALGRWREAGLPDLVLGEAQITVDARADGVTLTLTQTAACEAAADAILHRHTYRIAPDGRIAVENSFEVSPALPDLPRLGVTLTLPPGQAKLDWFGRGPRETYVDRNRAGWIGRFSGSVADQYVPYVMPQEHGNKTDLRWMALCGDQAGLALIPTEPCEGSASHFTPHDLYAATHTTDLAPRPEVLVNLDVRQRGLGTASCGPDTLARYLIPPAAYSLRFELRPFLAGRDPGEVAGGVPGRPGI